MKPAFLSRRPKYPRQWSDLPAGDDLKHIVELGIQQCSRNMFGYHMLKIGDLSSQLEIEGSPIKHLVNVTDKVADYTNIQAASNELPLAENSVDAVILAHELDFAQDPHQILREVNRVIIPNGYAVIVGFNPFSLAGMLKYLPINPKQVLHDARFFSIVRLKDWLHLLGFEIVDVQSLVFSELFFERKVNPYGRWQVWCKKHLPVFSSTYLIVAKKRVVPLSLVKPKWKLKPNFSAVSARMGSQT
jgi:SAM-dependent methyltransferase